ncbi:MAG: Trk system potassium transporter TrkA [Lachnospiraceae bacterium]|nr:Trk system potassium transporter TrkA [Lachnospiraceae bacterium]
MHIVIIGAGKVGSQIASQLVSEGHDIVMIDNNPKSLAAVGSIEDILCIEGEAVSRVTLKEADAGEADVVIACTNSDEINMLSCLLVRKMGAKRTIARVRNPVYYEQIDYIKDDLGLSLSINPERSAARAISRVLLFPAANNVETFSHGKVELVEFTLEKGNPLIGKSLMEISRVYKARVLMCAIIRGEKTFIPVGSDVLEENDRIFVAADHAQMIAFFKKIEAFRSGVKTVIIVGSGRIAYYLAERLISHGMTVKIIENSAARCEELAELLPSAIIVNADGTDEEVLGEEGIHQTDAFVALTGMDEVNVILSIYAEKKNVEKVVAKVSQISFSDMIDGLGLDSVFSPKTVTANQILQYVRALAASSELNSIESLCRLAGNRIEALEFLIHEGTEYIGTPLRMLNVKKGFLVAVIIRGNNVIIPGGDDTVEVGDSVIIVTTHNKVQSLDEVFE